MADKGMPVLPRHPGEQLPRDSRSGLALPVLIAVEGAALAVLTGLSGSPWWQMARVLAVLAVTALAAWLARRAGRAGRGAAALVYGIVGTVAGAGAGFAHLAKAGADAAALAGAVALVAGLTVMVWGGAALIRAVPGWWRLLAVPVVLAVLQFVVYPLTQAVYATSVPAGGLGPGTPAAYGLSYRPVALRTSDGVRLSAWYIPSRNGAAVVLLPGAGSTRTAVLRQGAVLARHGYGALLLDTRGHGLSGGHAMDFGWYGDTDIAAAVSFVQRQPGIRPAGIALLGESMGGEQAIIAAGSDPRIRAVVAEGVTGEQLADHGWLPWDAEGVIQRGVDWVTYSAAGLLTGASRPVPIRDALRAAAPRQVLIIAGGARPDEPTAARWFRAASPATVHVWVVPGAGHMAGLATQPAAWQAHVTGFLDTVTGSRHGR